MKTASRVIGLFFAVALSVAGQDGITGTWKLKRLRSLPGPSH